MRDDLENPMVVGDYYSQLKLYAVCAECGSPIYEGDFFHIIGKKGSSSITKICDDCHQRKMAVCEEDE